MRRSNHGDPSHYLPVDSPTGLAVGCGAQMRNIPVGRNNVQLSTSLGGPLVDAFGRTVPIPYGIVGTTYGLSDRAEVFLDFHATASAFKFLGVAPGIVYFPIKEPGKCVPAIGADVLVFSDFSATRAYPEFTTSVACRLGRCWIPYAAVRHTLQLSKAPRFIPSAMFGTSFRRGDFQYFVELQWLALDRDNRWNPVEYHGISNRGALSLQFGMTLDLQSSKGGDR